MLAGKVLNTSKVGTGKTLMALGCIERLSAQTALIVAPKSLLLQWQDEINRFMGGYFVTVASGTPNQRAKLYEAFRAHLGPKLLAVSYETLRIDMDILSQQVWQVAIFDEAHKLKEPNTQLKKKLKFLIAQHRFGLSGSPVVNHYGNTYNILNVLKPTVFPNYYAFINTFTVKSQYKGLLIFHSQDKIREMFAPHIVSKNLEDAGKSLPPLQEIEVPIELSAKERKIYDKMLMELVFEFEAGDVSKLSSPMALQNTLTKIGKLQECANHLSLVGDHTESSKLEALKEILDSQVMEDERVIIFSRFARMATLLNEAVGTHLITGQTPTLQRKAILDSFKTSKRGVLVMTNAGREGLNIQESNVVIHYDQDFTAAGMEQRNGRAHRLGQTQRVRVYHLLAQGTVDYRIRRLLAQKQALADDLSDTIKQLLYGENTSLQLQAVR